MNPMMAVGQEEAAFEEDNDEEPDDASEAAEGASGDGPAAVIAQDGRKNVDRLVRRTADQTLILKLEGFLLYIQVSATLWALPFAWPIAWIAFIDVYLKTFTVSKLNSQNGVQYL